MATSNNKIMMELLMKQDNFVSGANKAMSTIQDLSKSIQAASITVTTGNSNFIKLSTGIDDVSKVMKNGVNFTKSYKASIQALNTEVLKLKESMKGLKLDESGLKQIDAILAKFEKLKVVMNKAGSIPGVSADKPVKEMPVVKPVGSDDAKKAAAEAKEAKKKQDEEDKAAQKKKTAEEKAENKKKIEEESAAKKKQIEEEANLKRQKLAQEKADNKKANEEARAEKKKIADEETAATKAVNELKKAALKALAEQERADKKKTEEEAKAEKKRQTEQERADQKKINDEEKQAKKEIAALVKTGMKITAGDNKDTKTIDQYNKKLTEVIKNFEKLKSQGQNAGIDIKGSEGLNNTIKVLTNLQKKLEDLGRESTKVTEEVNRVGKTAEIPTAVTHVGELENKFLMAGVAAQLIGAAIKKVFAEIQAAIAAAINEALKFEQKVYQMRTVTENQLGDFQETANQVIEAAREVGASATEAADGIKTVYAAGINNAKDAISGYQSAVMAAHATQSDFNDLIKAGVIINNNYGTSVKDWDTIFNKISLAAKSSKADMADFAKQIPSLVSAFAPAGIALDDTLALFAAFNNSLRNSSEASVAAVNLLTKLQKPTKGMRKTLEEINAATKDIGTKITFSASAIGGDLDGFLKNFRAKVTEFAKDKRMNPADIIGNMFKELRASKGMTQALQAIFTGSFAKIKAQLQSDTKDLQEAYEESIHSILDRWDMLVNNVGSGFKSLFVAVQPTLQDLLDWLDGALNSVIGYVVDLVGEFEDLRDPALFMVEMFKAVFIALGLIVKNIFILVGNLISLFASAANIVIKSVAIIVQELKSMGIIVYKLPEIWRMAKEGNIKGIKDFFETQLELVKNKGKDLTDELNRFSGRVNVFQGMNLKTTFSEKRNYTGSDKKPGEASKENFDPIKALESFGKKTEEDDAREAKQAEELAKIKDGILKDSITDAISKYKYETGAIQKEYQERIDNLKTTLEDEQTLYSAYARQKSDIEIKYGITQGMLDANKKNPAKNPLPTMSDDDKKKYDNLILNISYSEEEIKTIRTKNAEATATYIEDRESKLAKAKRDYIKEEKQEREKATRDYVKNIDDEYDAKLDKLNKELNDIDSESKTKVQIIDEQNKVLLKMAEEYHNKAQKFQGVIKDKKGKVVTPASKENTEALRKESEIKEKIEKNNTTKLKEQLAERLELIDENYNSEVDKLAVKAFLEKQTEEAQIEDSINLHKGRIEVIEKLLEREKNLTLAQAKSLKKEKQKLETDNLIDAQKIIDLKLQTEIKDNERALNEKRSLIDLAANLEQKTIAETREAQKKANLEEIKELERINKLKLTGPEEKKNNEATIKGLQGDNQVLDFENNKDTKERDKNAEDSAFTRVMTNIDQAVERGKISEFKALEVTKQVNEERIGLLDKRIDAAKNAVQTEENIQIQADAWAEKEALEHQNKMIPEQLIQKQIDFALSVAEIFKNSSNQTLQNIGNLTTDVINQLARIPETTKNIAAAATGDVGAIMELSKQVIQEVVNTVDHLSKAQDKFSDSMKDGKVDLKSFLEGNEEMIRALPLIGGMLGDLQRTVTDLFNLTISEKTLKGVEKIGEAAKKAADEVQVLLDKVISQMEKDTAEINSWRQLQVDNIENENDRIYQQYILNMKLVDESVKPEYIKVEERMKLTLGYHKWAADQEKKFNDEIRQLQVDNIEEEKDRAYQQFQLDLKMVDESTDAEAIKIEKKKKITSEYYKWLDEQQKKADEKAEEYSNSIRALNEKQYNAEMAIIDKTLTAKRKALESEVTTVKKTIADTLKEIDKLYQDRKDDQEDKSGLNKIFQSKVKSSAGKFDAAFFRQNEKNFLDGDGISTGNKTKTENTEDNYDLGLISFDKRMQERQEQAIEKYTYYQKKFSAATSRDAREKYQNEMVAAQKEFYQFAEDKEAKALNKKLDDSKKELTQKEKDLQEATRLEKIEIDKITAHYKDSSLKFKDYFVGATRDWLKVAQDGIDSLGFDVIQQMKDSVTEIEKAKAEYQQLKNPGTGTGSKIPSGTSQGSTAKSYGTATTPNPGETWDQMIARFKKEDAAVSNANLSVSSQGSTAVSKPAGTYGTATTPNSGETWDEMIARFKREDAEVTKSLRGYAGGGVTSGKAIFGEAGPEAAFTYPQMVDMWKYIRETTSKGTHSNTNNNNNSVVNNYHSNVFSFSNVDVNSQKSIKTTVENVVDNYYRNSKKTKK
jgi:TP901 family phage tail tape measure protein